MVQEKKEIFGAKKTHVVCSCIFVRNVGFNVEADVGDHAFHTNVVGCVENKAG